MGILDDDVKRVRTETDITRIISQYVALKKVGRRWVGLCPFHNEKTPSFSVNAEEGFYYCFGCQASGDVITFLREIDQLDFVTAVERLAHTSGIQLRYTAADDGRRRSERREQSELVGRAVDFYHERLLSGPDAGKARAYLRQRGIDREVVDQFRLGYAPAGWDELARHLRVSGDRLAAAGLGFDNSRGRPTDFFRDRLMFPIFDPSGDPVAFGGRQLPEGDPPKYKNTPQVAIYDKSRVLYALNWAKKDIVEQDQIIVCEGYTDVIGCFRAGLPRAVATCGTALTDHHVTLMTRFARRVVLAFDADGAGRAAADRFYGWERAHDIEVFVADLPDGQDPGQLAETDPDRLAAAIDGARPFLAYRIDRVLDAQDMERPEGRARGAELAAAAIAEHPNDLVRDQYLRDVAGRCMISLDQMRRLVADPPRRSQDADRADMRRPRPGAEDRPEPRRLRLPTVEVDLLRAVVHTPDPLSGLVAPELFTHELLAEAYAVVCSEGWRDRLDAIDPAVGRLLSRLLVEEVSNDPEALLVRVLDGVIERWQGRMLQETRGDAARLAEYAPLSQWLHLRQEEMHLEATRHAAATALVAWISDQRGAA